MPSTKSNYDYRLQTLQTQRDYGRPTTICYVHHTDIRADQGSELSVLPFNLRQVHFRMERMENNIEKDREHDQIGLEKERERMVRIS